MVRAALLLLALPFAAQAAPSSFDGLYAGPAQGSGGGACVNFKMYLRVKDGEASAKYSESWTFTGEVKPDGSIDIPLRSRAFIGKITNGVFTGRVEGPCRYNVELTRQ